MAYTHLRGERIDEHPFGLFQIILRVGNEQERRLTRVALGRRFNLDTSLAHHELHHISKRGRRI